MSLLNRYSLMELTEPATFFSLSKYVHIYRKKLSLEREVDQTVNDMVKKEGWTRSYALSVIRSKFESEERYQEVAYVNDLIKKEAEEQEEEEEEEAQHEPRATVTTTTNTVAEGITATKEPAGKKSSSSKKPSKVTLPQQETTPSKSISKQLDKQTIQINKKNGNLQTNSKAYTICR
jgi:hypothetical protein